MALLFACEEHIDMGSDHQPIPVVYCLFARQDSVHQVILTKTFCGNKDPLKMAKILDSLFFQDAEVYFEYDWDETKQRVYLEKKLLHDKKPGTFSNPDHIIYQTNETIPDIWKIELFVEIPGLPLVSAKIIVLSVGDELLVYPKYNGQTISITEELPWKIELSEDWAWNYYRETKIKINIIEKIADEHYLVWQINNIQQELV
ncbi:hypothetical protein ACFLSY_05480, partial [Bacteroidota bacterium]